MTKRLVISLVLNLATAVLVVVAFGMGFFKLQFVPDDDVGEGVEILKYFTVQSNLFAGACAAIFAGYEISLIKDKRLSVPAWAYIVKYVSVVGVTLTFLTVACYLAPVYTDDYFSLFANNNLIFHFLVPAFAFVSFCFFEPTFDIPFKGTFLSVVHCLLYGLFYMPEAYINMDKWAGGDKKAMMRYNWYGFASKNAAVTVAVIAVMLFMTYLIGLSCWAINRAVYKKSAYRSIIA